MPTGIRPDNCVGKKGRSGRKPITEEMVNRCKERMYKDLLKEVIPDVMLAKKHLELLNTPIKVKTFKQGTLVNQTESLDTFAVSKGLDMAYKLRGDYAPEKIDHTTKGEKITDDTEILKLTNILNAIHSRTSQPSDGELASPMGEEISNKE